ncbi:MAG: hypothetical protein M1834_007823 [Cirrosporium novae-zelandiae]|nr:MAG: hypothetical protein M1834_007823 [Cirrosporium novae-zelandiae]
MSAGPNIENSQNLNDPSTSNAPQEPWQFSTTTDEEFDLTSCPTIDEFIGYQPMASDANPVFEPASLDWSFVSEPFMLPPEVSAWEQPAALTASQAPFQPYYEQPSIFQAPGLSGPPQWSAASSASLTPFTLSDGKFHLPPPINSQMPEFWSQPQYQPASPSMMITPFYPQEGVNSSTIGRGDVVQSFAKTDQRHMEWIRDDRDTTPEEGAKPKFICKFPGCKSKGFRRNGDRLRHQRKHDQTSKFGCTAVGCHLYGSKIFYRWDKVKSHVIASHDSNTLFPCLVDGCQVEPMPSDLLIIHIENHDKLLWGPRHQVQASNPDRCPFPDCKKASKHLKEHPESERFKCKEIIASAGYDSQSCRLICPICREDMHQATNPRRFEHFLTHGHEDLFENRRAIFAICREFAKSEVFDDVLPAFRRSNYRWMDW